MTYEETLRALSPSATERIIVMTAENRAAIRNLPPRSAPASSTSASASRR